MASSLDIRRRVKSAKSIRQITRAMELVSAAKMQRAVTAVQQSRRYATLAREVLESVTNGLDIRHHPLLAVRPRKRLLLIAVSSNRGLAGGFNSRVVASAREYLTAQRLAHPGLQVDTISLGRKAQQELIKFGEHIMASFEHSDRAPSAAEMTPLVHMVFNEYLSGKYDAVAVAYTEFASMMRQEATVKQILPLTNVKEFVDDTDESKNEEAQETIEPDYDEAPNTLQRIKQWYKDYYAAILEKRQANEFEQLFEPNASAVLQSLVPRLLETQLYQSLLESVASEHAARMMAMRNATDAAGDLIDDLTLTMNQLRQSGITQELSEISAGRLALGL